MDFRILGPLEVVEQGRPLPLGGAKQRTLLALLLTRANEVVSSDRLIDELWGAQPPPTAANALHYHVSQLRKALAPHEVIVTQEPGYLIRVGPDDLDLLRFETLVRGGAVARRPRSRRDDFATLSSSGAAAARRPHPRFVATGDSPTRRAPPGGARAAVRRRPRARPLRRGRRRSPGARPRSSAPGAAASRAHASALRLRSPGRSARDVSRDAAAAGRRARHRAEPGPPGARAGDPSSRPGVDLAGATRATARPSDHGRRHRPGPGRRPPLDRRAARPTACARAHPGSAFASRRRTCAPRAPRSPNDETLSHERGRRFTHSHLHHGRARQRTPYDSPPSTTSTSSFSTQQRNSSKAASPTRISRLSSNAHPATWVSCQAPERWPPDRS